NLASGGNSPVSTDIGKREALASWRPEPSTSHGGISILYSDDSLNGPLNVSDEVSPGSSTANRRAASGPTSAICFACAPEIGAVNESVIGVSGMHPAFALSRSHRIFASNTLRVL